MNAIRIAKVFTLLILLFFCLELTFLVYPPVFVLGLSVIRGWPVCSSLQAKNINLSARTTALPSVVVYRERSSGYHHGKLPIDLFTV